MEHILHRKTASDKLIPALTGRNGHKKDQYFLFSLLLGNGGLKIVLNQHRSKDYEAS